MNTIIVEDGKIVELWINAIPVKFEVWERKDLKKFKEQHCKNK